MPRRIGKHIGAGAGGEELEEADALREVFARWASGVGVVALRESGKVHALTVSAFLPVSLDPPLILVSLGGNAAVLPFLDDDAAFAFSVLGAGQGGLATRYADTFPVGPSPFPPEGPPVVAGALATLVCEVDEVLERGDHHLLIGRVRSAASRGDGRPLVWWNRDYRELRDS